jgi:Ni/Fe-hydrogenase subunit HybB-like protein
MLGWIGGALAAMTAVYTAYLFAQARARDLWQSPLLPPHLLAQAAVAGAAVLVLLTAPEGVDPAITVTLRVALGAHAALALGEASMGHPTAHAALAASNMIKGPYGHFYWVGIALVFLALLFAAWAPVIAALSALGGLYLYEHAFVQAGQSVPLA